MLRRGDRTYGMSLRRALFLALVGAFLLGPATPIQTYGVAQAAPAALDPVPVPVLRRLTRAEYGNSLRDLFGIEFAFANELPADAQAAGFDNIGDALSLSPVLLETYLKVARRVSDLVIGTGGVSPTTLQFPATGSQSAWVEGLPIGTRGGVLVKHYFPRDGEYELRGILYNRTVLSPLEGVRFFRTRTAVTAGPHSFVVTFPQENSQQEGAVPNLPGIGGAGLGGPVDIRGSALKATIQFWLDGKKIKTLDIAAPSIGEASFEAQVGPPTLARAEITGPFNPSAKLDTEARRKLMVCTPKKTADETACAAKILAPVARRAYRRELKPNDMQEILAAYTRKRADGSFDEAIGMGLRRILASPEFLFRVERDPPGAKPGQTYAISDYELATRLSYFLWNSIPDDELLDLARKGKLKDRATLSQQARRMLADPRAEALVNNFGVQWLGLADVRSVRPDPTVYPEFDDGLARDFEQETRLFLRAIVQENRSVLDAISSDYTFLNERLARLYGIPGVKGPAFTRVQFAPDQHRGGLLGQGSILLMTSHAGTTSPILRGKWILTKLLNSPLPTPPMVPPLDTSQPEEGRKLSVKEQLERHRTSPACKGCHIQMDPFGLALENFDVLGRWRNDDNGAPIDSLGVLPGNVDVAGPDGLKKVLLDRSDKFVGALVGSMMTYAVGRRLQDSDKPVITDIVAAAKPNGARFQDLVLGVIDAPVFRMRQVPDIAKEKEAPL